MIARLVFGGTFDPVHLGHIRLSVELLSLFPGSCLHLVPCMVPAHRPQPDARAEDRLQMLRLAIKAHPGIDVSDCEMTRPGISYTLDTLAHFRSGMPADDPLIFVMGLDSWASLTTWYRWREFSDLAHLLVIDRPGIAPDTPPELVQWSAPKRAANPGELTEAAAGKICHLALSPWDVSATEIRARIAAGRTVKGLIDPVVADYISHHHLYGADSRVEA